MKKYELIKDFKRKGKTSPKGTIVELSNENAIKFAENGYIEMDGVKKKSAPKKATSKKVEKPVDEIKIED